MPYIKLMVDIFLFPSHIFLNLAVVVGQWLTILFSTALVSKLLYQRQLIAAIQKLVILVKVSSDKSHLLWIILGHCIDDKDYFQSSACFECQKLYLSIFLQQDLIPKMVAHRLNPWFKVFTCFLFSSVH